MQNTKIDILKAGIHNVSAVYMLLAISGLSFCFFLGFPFDNHNESYIWIVALQKTSLHDIVTKKIIGGIETFRPLGMANAWLGYRLSGNIYLQQLLNWLFAIASFITLYAASGNKILFALISFSICTCFFSGYIYLFHLHGVFYGPFQLYVAALVYTSCKYRKLSSRILAIISFATIIVSLYHTFALLAFCAFLTGYLLQLSKTEKIIQFARLIIIILLAIAFVAFFLESKELKSLPQLINGFITSYRMAELSTGAGIAAAILVLLAIIPFFKSLKRQVIAAITIIILSAVLIYTNIPVLLLWVIACLIRTMFEKNWVLAAMIAATAVLPFGSGTGSPTYIVFVLMICAFVTAGSKVLYITDSVFLRRTSISFMLVLCICLFCVKAGFKIPVASYFAKPVMAEQEKTRQLKDILAWKLNNKQYGPFSLTLYDAADLPVNSDNSISRVNRPVTDQKNINTYIDFSSNDIPNEKKDHSLFVTFGNKMLQNKHVVFFVNGNWNGTAYVFE